MFVHGRDEASILHADLDAFFASVEQRDAPELRGRPVIVGIGVVMCASYEARAHGIRGGMGGAEATRRCPTAVFVPPRMAAYTEASRAVFGVFADTTPLVEGLSVDEAFLDVGGLWRTAGEPAGIAARLRGEVRQRVGLPISVGVARTKFLAKVASASAKPDGLLVVPPGEERPFLHPLPVERVWGIGPRTAELLHRRGIHRVADIAALPESALVAMLGPHRGRHVHALARLRDARRVQTGRRRRSIGSQRALSRKQRTSAELDTILVSLVDRVTSRLRAADRVARTIVLRLRFDDFTRATRSHTIDQPTAETATMLVVARALLAGAQDLIDQQGATLLGLSVANLDDADAVQLTLPFHQRDGLDTVVDDVRDRFGRAAITRAVLLHRNDGEPPPRLPD